jgi:hypothetical protein
MEGPDVPARLDRAVSRLAANDGHLLENSLSERCIAGRLAMYLQGEFPEHAVDVEYNRKGSDAKALQLSEDCENFRDEEGLSLVVPDVIVHKRGERGPNILVLELKKTSNPLGNDCDRARVVAFRRKLRYEFGALIECETRRNREAGIRVSEWFDG